jgi:hypothetical protein
VTLDSPNSRFERLLHGGDEFDFFPPKVAELGAHSLVFAVALGAPPRVGQGVVAGELIAGAGPPVLDACGLGTQIAI